MALVGVVIRDNIITGNGEDGIQHSDEYQRVDIG
jgi:hypothetical protein